jgi:hypothetical protein
LTGERVPGDNSAGEPDMKKEEKKKEKKIAWSDLLLQRIH